MWNARYLCFKGRNDPFAQRNLLLEGAGTAQIIPDRTNDQECLGVRHTPALAVDGDELRSMFTQLSLLIAVYIFLIHRHQVDRV